MCKKRGYGLQMKGNHLFFEMVQMTVQRFIMEGRCKAFGEKNHLGEAYTETRGEFANFYFCQDIMKIISHNFSYLVIHANLLSYFFLIFKIGICLGNFSASIDISEDYEYSFFFFLCQF